MKAYRITHTPVPAILFFSALLYYTSSMCAVLHAVYDAAEVVYRCWILCFVMSVVSPGDCSARPTVGHQVATMIRGAQGAIATHKGCVSVGIATGGRG